MKIKEYFSEQYFCIKTLIDSTIARDYLEKLVNNNDNVELEEQYKKKLKNIYRIRNNAFGMLLKYGFKCYKKDDMLYMNIENRLYDCKPNALKSILGKKTDAIIEKSLIDEADIYDYVLYDVSSTNDKKIEIKEVQDVKPSKENKHKIKHKKDIEEIMPTQEEIKIDISKPEIPTQEVVEEKVEVIIEKPTEEIKEEKVIEAEPQLIQCPSCGEMVSADLERCIICGERLKVQETTVTDMPTIDEFADDTLLDIPIPQAVMSVPIPNTSGTLIEPIKTPDNILTREQFDAADNEIVFVEEYDNEIMLFGNESKQDVIEEVVQEESKQESITIDIQKPQEEVIHKASDIKKQAEIIKNSKVADVDVLDAIQPNSQQSIVSVPKSQIIMDIYTIIATDPLDPDELVEEQVDTKRKKVGEEEKKVEKKTGTERTIKLYVMPITYPDNGSELSSEVITYITYDGKSGVFVSPMDTPENRVPKMAEIETDIHQFRVRGSWRDGVFSSTVYANGETLSQQCIVKQEVENIRPQTISNMGHPLNVIDINFVDGSERFILHSIPIELENDTDGLCKTIYLLDIPKTNERKKFMTKSTNEIYFNFEDDVYKTISLWDNDEFKTYVIPYDN